MADKATTEQKPQTPTIADDVAAAEATQKQLLAQLLEAAKQPDGPDGVSFSQRWADERKELVMHFVGKQAFPNPPPGKTTAMMKDPFYGQEIDTIFSEYGDNGRLHKQRLREGWVPVVDKQGGGGHVQDRYGAHLYMRSILFRKAQDKAMREMREAQMKAGTVTKDALADANVREGVAFHETTMKTGG